MVVLALITYLHLWDKGHAWPVMWFDLLTHVILTQCYLADKLQRNIFAFLMKYLDTDLVLVLIPSNLSYKA